MKVARQILVSGRVQGVGYRYFAQKNARMLGVTGYVRNLFDGSVEIVAEGEKEQVDRYIEILKEGPVFGKVEHADVSTLAYENRYDTFSVAY